MPGPERTWKLAVHPDGHPRVADFRLDAEPTPTPAVGEALVRVLYHTVAPGVRAKLAGETYTAQVKVGDPIPGFGVGVVTRSETPDLAVGDRVVGELAWSTCAVVRPGAVQKLDPDLLDDTAIPLAASIGVLGGAGLAAYFGLLRVGNAQPGETIVVSSAAGTVGSTVGQIARVLGCRVIGIAGGAEKCAELKSTFGFDEALDYREEPDLAAAIRSATPQGVDLYFDNVGGEISEAAVINLKLFGRVVVCGQTSEYNRVEPRGFRAMTEIIARRLTLRGFVVHDFQSEFVLARQQLAGWMREGTLVDRTRILQGIELAAAAFVAQFDGSGGGSTVIQPT